MGGFRRGGDLCRDDLVVVVFFVAHLSVLTYDSVYFFGGLCRAESFVCVSFPAQPFFLGFLHRRIHTKRSARASSTGLVEYLSFISRTDILSLGIFEVDDGGWWE